MRQDFINTAQLIETDAHFGITVIDLSNAPKDIVKNKSKEDIITEYGSVDGFFNQLLTKGVTKIGILPKRKNGYDPIKKRQNWIDHPRHPYFEVPLIPKTTDQPLQRQFITTAPVNYSQSSNDSKIGLSYPEAIALHVDRNDKVRLDTENKYLKEENERLKAEVYDFKDKELKWNNSTAKSDSNTKLLGMLFQNLDKVGPLLGSITGKGAAPGLSNPIAATQTKQQLIDAILSNDEMTTNVLTTCYNGLCLDDETFANELNALLKKHNLIA